MEAAFFDLDKTVITKASLVAFGRPLYDAGMISRWLVLRAMWSNLIFHYLGADEERMRKFRTSALRITRGWDQALVSGIVRDTLVEVIEPIVYAEALELIQEHQQEGRRVFLISASPEEIVAPLAQFLGVDEAIASRAELDDEGRYTGNVEFWSYGPYKAEAIRLAAERCGIDLDASYAYSDSATDLPMLESVGHPVAVNPDRDLARIARDRGWETRRFEHGVPLRDRVYMPRPSPLVLVPLGAGAVSIAGGLAWWWWASHRPAPIAPPVVTPSTWSRLRVVSFDPRSSVGRAAAPALWAGRIRAGTGRSPQAVVALRASNWDLLRGALIDRRGDRSAPEITRPAASSLRRLRGRTGRRSR